MINILLKTKIRKKKFLNKAEKSSEIAGSVFWMTSPVYKKMSKDDGLFWDQR